MIPQEPQSAADYDDRTTAAVKTVLVEIGQILGSFKGKFAIVGGAVPWLLLDNQDMPHVGTLDVDVKLFGDFALDSYVSYGKSTGCNVCQSQGNVFIGPNIANPGLAAYDATFNPYRQGAQPGAEKLIAAFLQQGNLFLIS